MSKHDVLTEEEFARYAPNQNIIRSLQEFTAAWDLPASELRVLDWGCGRGRDVLWLRDHGYQAFGVDTDPEPIRNGLPLFQSRGLAPDCLSLLDESSRSGFPTGSFDFVFSGNVLEHVEDLGKVAAEIARVTRTRGGGYHVFPAHRQPIEGHLFMPFVHWLPPGRVRRLLVFGLVLLGREPDWEEVQRSSVSTKVDFYYQYTVKNTFYRPYRKVRREFESAGFSVTFRTTSHPSVRSNPLLSTTAGLPALGSLLNHLLLTFKLVEMSVARH